MAPLHDRMRLFRPATATSLQSLNCGQRVWVETWLWLDRKRARGPRRSRRPPPSAEDLPRCSRSALSTKAAGVAVCGCVRSRLRRPGPPIATARRRRLQPSPTFPLHRLPVRNANALQRNRRSVPRNGQNAFLCGKSSPIQGESAGTRRAHSTWPDSRRIHEKTPMKKLIAAILPLLRAVLMVLAWPSSRLALTASAEVIQ
jgi:hypothetical protein